LSEPRQLFEGAFSVDGVFRDSFGVSADGKRFLLIRAEPRPTEIVIVQNWLEELKRLVPVK
jgi:hypothetical protein